MGFKNHFQHDQWRWSGNTGKPWRNHFGHAGICRNWVDMLEAIGEITWQPPGSKPKNSNRIEQCQFQSLEVFEDFKMLDKSWRKHTLPDGFAPWKALWCQKKTGMWNTLLHVSVTNHTTHNTPLPTQMPAWYADSSMKVSAQATALCGSPASFLLANAPRTCSVRSVGWRQYTVRD